MFVAMPGIGTGNKGTHTKLWSENLQEGDSAKT